GEMGTGAISTPCRTENERARHADQLQAGFSKPRSPGGGSSGKLRPGHSRRHAAGSCAPVGHRINGSMSMSRFARRIASALWLCVVLALVFVAGPEAAAQT